MTKVRLDVLLVDRGLAESRAKAQALIMAGQVRIAGQVALKPATAVDVSAALTVDSGPRFVSRGGEKLDAALEAFAIEVRGLVGADVGASTGGFTDCLLQAGASRVIALDVGYGQLHPRVRQDPRVTVLERTNARHLTVLPFPPQLVTCDVSFISAATVLDAALPLAAPGWEALVLVKPQFEAGREDVPKGVVRDPAVHRRVLEAFCARAVGWRAVVGGIVDSGHPGPKGNREFVVHLLASEEPVPVDPRAWIAAAVG